MFTIPQNDPVTGCLNKTNVYFVPLGGVSSVVALAPNGGLVVEPIGGSIEQSVPLTPTWSIDAEDE
jgi:hypothetical protein